MTDLPARLQQALGDAYRIDREMGGGGMSRLFVATERSLNRQVVVKVLPPELTSEVSAARFKQEIEVAARLQHPHILPILAAGASGDLLYYIMPYVGGESLRHRLASGKLPVREATRILDEIAGALGYAHRQGIVHRDIKPENILLEDGQAVLADFGVARAIVAARTADFEGGAAFERSKVITATGMSVGTPTYMAPEQAAGESVDSRADLYALAVVGYEMLAGEHPFAATSAQQMIVAHLTVPAPSVSKLRPETPIAVSAGLARALEKDRDARFRTAEDFRAALEGGTVHHPRTRSSLRYVIGGALLVALVAIGIVVARRQHVVQLDANLVAVAPFDVVDADLKLWHEGMVDVLSRNLDGAGPLRTVSPTLVVRRFTGRADKESAAALGQATGARLAVFGSLIRSGSDSVLGSATVVDASSGHVLAEIRRGDAMSRMSRLSDSLTIGLLRELGRTRALGGAQISSVGTTSLPALKSFLQGEQYLRQSAWDSAIVYYEQALASDSQFSIAWNHEGEALGWSSREDASVSHRRRASLFNRGLSPRDSILIASDLLFSTLTDTGTPETELFATQRRLFATLNDAAHFYPNDPTVWEKIGDAQIHWGFGSVAPTTLSDVLHSFDRSLALDSAYTPAYYHAVTLAFAKGTEIGRRYLTAYFSQHPSGARASGMSLGVRLTDPAVTSASERQRIIDSASDDQLHDALEVLRMWPDSIETALRIETARAARAIKRRPEDSVRINEEFAYHTELRGHSDAAVRIRSTVARTLERAVLGALPKKVVDTLLSGRLSNEVRLSAALSFYGYRGDTLAIQRAIRTFEITRAIQTPAHVRSEPYYLALTRAFTSLMRHDTASALREFAMLPDSLCFNCGWPALPLVRARLLESRGKYADADQILNEAGVSPSLTTIYFELEHARIAEKRNDLPRAREAYSYVADMWQNGDPPFQVCVAEARAALKRLGNGDAATRIPMGSSKDSIH